MKLSCYPAQPCIKIDSLEWNYQRHRRRPSECPVRLSSFPVKTSNLPDKCPMTGANLQPCKEFSMSSSDQSNLDEPSTVFFLFTLSILLSGVATRMDYSISFSFWLLLLLLHCSLTLLGRCGFLGWKIDMEEFVRIKNIKITLSNTWRIMHKHKPFSCNLILSSLCFPLHEVFWAWSVLKRELFLQWVKQVNVRHS